jgi:hypothetical protein
MEVSKILDANEKVLWQGKPNFLLFAISRTVSCGCMAIFFSIFFSVFAGTFGTMILGFLGASTLRSPVDRVTGSVAIPSPTTSSEANTLLTTSTSVAGIIFLCWVLFLVFVYILVLLSYRNYAYVITTKRVIITKGVIGKDIKMLDYDKIQNIEVNVGLFDKLLMQNTGTISFFTGEYTTTKNGMVPTKDIFESVENPYEVFKQVKQVSHDIKTDIEYPNQLRPNENPGYNSEYTKK